ncbi:cellulose biosynthesis protein BcsN [Rhizobium terrae]|uniref:cellulose biosynthesis protein BcsN n=1 Tax=Rhizobium terrae TaxID=2171756 RepID=UPI0013C324AC|nr:cellulose biosynthesis protein BcsN [Rhizobium terrae]
MSGPGHLRAAILFSVLPVFAVGCAGQPTQMGTFARAIPSEQAMLLPPPGGPGIVSVIERRYDNAVAQDIYLKTSAQTPGQNAFTVQFFGTASPFKLSDNALTSTPVTEAGTASEMRQSLPGIRMTRSSFFVQNGYGPFGYAFGHGAGNDLCMYAWQQVRAPSGTISPLANYGSIQVRLRLCQADATEERLLAVMYNYTITGSVDAGGWNPYGEPQPVSPSIGGIGAPIYPRPAAAEPIVPVLPQRQAAAYTRTTLAPAVQRVATQSITSAITPVSNPAQNPAQNPGMAARPALPAANTPAESAAAVGVPRVTVPRPGLSTATPPAQPSLAAQAAARAPLVPSPSGIAANPRTTIPPASCTDVTSGTANACR